MESDRTFFNGKTLRAEAWLKREDSWPAHKSQTGFWLVSDIRRPLLPSGHTSYRSALADYMSRVAELTANQ